MFVCFYLRYRHQVELVRFLNQFADPQMDMPPGWDKKVDQSGRVLYFHLPQYYFIIVACNVFAVPLPFCFPGRVDWSRKFAPILNQLQWAISKLSQASVSKRGQVRSH